MRGPLVAWGPLLSALLAAMPSDARAGDSVSLPTASDAPADVVTETREIDKRIEEASDASERGAVREAIERLVARQAASRQEWLLPAWNGPAPAPATPLDGDAAGAPAAFSEPRLVWPLDRWAQRMRWRLVVAAGRGIVGRDGRQPGLERVRAAAASHDLEELTRLAGGAVDAGVLVEALDAAGDVAAERGWLATSREAWQQAAEMAGSLGKTDLSDAILGKLTWLGRIDEMNARRGLRSDTVAAAGGSAWSQRRPPARPREARLEGRWSEAAPRPPLVMESLDGGDLVVWGQSGGIHARRLSDGSVPWSDPASLPTASQVFPPRGVASSQFEKPAASTPSLGAWAERLVACLPGGDARQAFDEQEQSPRLVCLDMSDAAEGRLVWETPLPAGAVNREAALAVSEGIVCVLLTTDAPQLAAFRLDDGQPLWQRSIRLSSPIAVGPPAEARLAVAEDLIMVAVGDGSVWAIGLDGGVHWASRPRQAPPGPTIPPAVAVAGGVVVVSQPAVRGSREGILKAFDLREGSLLWGRDAPPSTTLVGITGSLVIAEEGEAIVSRRLGDGSELTRRLPKGWRRHGEPALCGTGLAWPVIDPRQPGSRLRILRLDPATLEDVGEPIVLEEESGRVSLALARGQLVVADTGSITAVTVEGGW